MRVAFAKRRRIQSLVDRNRGASVCKMEFPAWFPVVCIVGGRNRKHGRRTRERSRIVMKRGMRRENSRMSVISRIVNPS